MSLTYEKMRQMADEAHINMSVVGRNVLTGGPVDRLPPRLWERLRLRLQAIYRNATGEEFATLSIDPAPAHVESGENR